MYIQAERPDDKHNYNLIVQQVIGMKHDLMTARAFVKNVALREGRLIPPWDSAEWSDPNSKFEFPYASSPDIRDAAGNLTLGPAVPKSTLSYGAVPFIPYLPTLQTSSASGSASAGYASTGVSSTEGKQSAVPLAGPPVQETEARLSPLDSHHGRGPARCANSG